MRSAPPSRDLRILIPEPSFIAGDLTESVLAESGLTGHVCRDLSDLSKEIPLGVGAVLLTEETLTAREIPEMVQAVRAQPSWSDVPVILLATYGADSPAASCALDLFGNVMILERPVRLTTLLSTLKTALRGRMRQYELRDQSATVNQTQDRLRLAVDSRELTLWEWDLLEDRVQSLYFAGENLEPSSGIPFEESLTNVHAEDRGAVRGALQAAVLGDGRFDAEFRSFGADGKIRWYHGKGNVFSDAAGRAYKMLGISVDITDLKWAHETQTLHASIITSTDDAIVSKSPEGVILSWNAGAERLFGYRADEIIGRSIFMLIPPDKMEEEQSILENLRRGQHMDHYETSRLSKTGERIDISLTVSPLRDTAERIIGAAAVMRDITNRRRNEQALRIHSERLTLLWEAAAVLLTLEDPEAMLLGVFQKIAPHLELDAYFHFMVTETGDALRLESSTGVPAEDVLKMARLEFGEGISGVVARDRRRIVATRIQESADPMVRIAREHGVRTYVCTPLLAENRLIGTLSFASCRRDAFEAEELEFLETICHYVTVAYDRVRLIRQLQETDRHRNEFLATLAHELRNPLAPIRNSLHILRLSGNDFGAVEEARTMMERQLGQMVRLTDDLLDASRITRGRLELRKERIELASVIDNALDTARPHIEASGHRVTVSMPAEPLYLDADPVRMGQVFANLLNNAAKYMDRGGEIWVQAQGKGSNGSGTIDTIVVRVRDAGIGIPPEELSSIFEMFTQLDLSLERTEAGLGIGLTLVKQLLDMHGGTIEARSGGKGEGSEFTVRLPAAKGPAPEPEPRAEAQPAPARKRKILVADDNRDTAESLGMLLRLKGHEVRVAHDGEQAVTEAEAFRPDLALLDIGMPRLNGYDAARRIRSEVWGRSMLLIALTGWGEAEDKRKASLAGFDYHFTKPVKMADLDLALRDTTPRGGSMAP